jgi:hypothetical protein
MTLNIVLLIIAVVIIIVLAIIAGVLQYRVYQQNRQQSAAQAAQAQEGRDQRARVNRSIQIIAQSVENDDLTLTEASIRISVLLDSLGVGDDVREEFSAFYQLAEATDHIPILDAWKKLDRKQQRDFDRQREQAEERFQDFVKDAAQRIRGREF